MALPRFTPLPQFRPTPWLSGPHAQTLWSMLAPVRRPDLLTSEMETTDGDVVQIQRTGPVAGQPVVILLHGLEGSARSAYAAALLLAFHQQGWCGVLLHARGSDGLPNRQAKGYHAGWWQDAQQLALQVRAEGATRVAAIGVSLGGNQLLRWLGETGEDSPLCAGVAVCPPVDLEAATIRLEEPRNRRYHLHLLHCLKASAWAKRQHNGLDRRTLDGLASIRAFDDALTAPQHGFAGVLDYYTRASARPVLAAIRRPTLILAAADDPLIPVETLLIEPAAPLIEQHLLTHGGHLGFVSGWWPRRWLPGAVVAWLQPHLEH